MGRNKNRQGNDNQGGMMDKIGEKIEDVVDAVTGNNNDANNNGQQKGHNRKNKR